MAGLKTLALGLMAGLAVAGSASAAITVSSKDIAPGAKIPLNAYFGRCAGENTSPDLTWTAPPATARSVVVTMIDLDANPPRGWIHWLITDLSPAVRALPAHTTTVPAPGQQPKNNFGNAAYDGPCPPKGSGVHHYRFQVWAMPTAATTFPAGASGAQIIEQLKKDALDSGELIGTAERN